MYDSVRTGTDQICTDSRSDHLRTKTYFSFIHPVPFLDIFLICYNSMISFVQQNLWRNNHLKIRSSDIKTGHWFTQIMIMFIRQQISVITGQISVIIVTLERIIVAKFSPGYYEFIFLHRFWRELNGNVVTGIEIDDNAQSSGLFVKVRII